MVASSQSSEPPVRARFRFGVRTLLGLTAVIAAALCPLAWRYEQARRLADDVQTMRAAGWRVQLDTPAPPGSRNGPATERWRDFWWARRLFGDAFFDHVVQVEAGQWHTPQGRRAIEALARMPRVEKLWLGDLGQEVETLSLPECAFRERLTSLEIAADTIDAESLAALVDAPNLRSVIVRASSGNVHALDRLKNARQLRSITVWGTAPPDAVVDSWTELRALVHLDIDASAVAPATMRRLMAGRAWELVWLARCQSSAATCGAIDNRRSLWSLSFDHADFGDDALKAIAGAPALAELHVEGTPLQGDGFFDGSGFPSLRQLHARGAAIDDRGAVAIGRLPAIQRAVLAGTQVTPQGFARLKADRPQMIVEGP